MEQRTASLTGVGGDDGATAGLRLRSLLRANAAVIGHLDLATVLRQVVASARDLVNADYGALGVVSSDGSRLEQFVHVGMSAQQVAALGHLPEGEGLLGALIADPRPIRLRDLGADARSVGFPEGHPPMRGFLGVPIRIRNEVFGNLYLTTTDEGGFDADDETLVDSLAATAAVAIQNARLYEASRRRQEWLQATSDTTLAMLTGGSDEVFGRIGRNVKELADADVVTVVQPDLDRNELVVEAAVGEGEQVLTASAYPLAGTLSAEVMASGRPVVVDLERADPDQTPRPGTAFLASKVPVGPLMVLPLVGATQVRGTLVVGRLKGRPGFTQDDVDMASAFADQASVALELIEARREQQRAMLLEDRARIARDLHDHVIQQLFAAGMALQAAAVGLDDDRAVLMDKIAEQVDTAIRQIRSSIFQLTPQRFGRHLRAAVMDVAAEVTPALGFAPEVRFTGPVDILTDTALTAEVAAVVREALTNVARHARARHASVSVDGSTDEMIVRVSDDGVGLAGAGPRRSGLENLRRRAEDRGGECRVDDLHPGTRITWTAALE